jgi:hypothetical protein
MPQARVGIRARPKRPQAEKVAADERGRRTCSGGRRGAAIGLRQPASLAISESNQARSLARIAWSGEACPSRGPDTAGGPTPTSGRSQVGGLRYEHAAAVIALQLRGVGVLIEIAIGVASLKDAVFRSPGGADRNRTRWKARTMMRSLLILLAVSLLTSLAAASRAEFAEHLCVVPILDGAPTDADVGMTSRMASRVETFPSSPYPVIYALNRGGVWTISGDRRFVPYPGEFPSNVADDYIEEAHSGRIIGTSNHLDGAFALDPVSGAFSSLRAAGIEGIGWIARMAYIPRWRGTLLGAESGLYLLQDDRILTIPGTDPQTIGHVEAIADLPAHRAITIGTSGGRVFILTDTRKLFDAFTFSRSEDDYFTAVHEIEAPGQILVQSNFQTTLVDMAPGSDGEFAPVRARVIEEETGYRHGHSGHYVAPRRLFLFYPPRPDFPGDFFGAGLHRLTESGFVPVPGGERERLGDFAIVRVVPRRDLVTIAGETGQLYHYEQDRLVPIPGSRREEIGWVRGVLHLTSLGKLVLVATRGILEILPNDTLSRLPLPVATDDPEIYDVAEMPASNVAIIFSSAGIFALEQSGRIARVRGDDAGGPITLVGPQPHLIPKRNELFFVPQDRLSLVVDERIAGPGVCEPESMKQ